MQSYLQYRSIRRHIEQQLEQVAANESDHGGGASCEDSRARVWNARNAVSSYNGRTATGSEGKGQDDVLIVTFDSPDDPLNPQNWSNARKWTYTFLIGGTGFIVSGAAAFDTPVTPQTAEYFDVSQEIALLSTTLYMIALGLGSLVSAPFSETVGRNPIYIVCKCLWPGSYLEIQLRCCG